MWQASAVQRLLSAETGAQAKANFLTSFESSNLDDLSVLVLLSSEPLPRKRLRYEALGTLQGKHDSRPSGWYHSSCL